jgi:hypothetical protein
MSNGGSNAGILATRRDGDVLIADEPTRVELRWTELPSADGEAMDVTWSASIWCVDSPADRALLAERFLGGSTTSLAVGRVATDLSRAMLAPVRSVIAAEPTDLLLSASSDARITDAIETAARTAAFAAGLAIVPPLSCVITCPSRDRARRLSESSERLAAIAVSDDARARSMAELSRALVEASGDPARAARSVAGIRLADPLDLLRVTALVDPSWSAASPPLWIAAGTRLARVGVSDTTIDPQSATSLGDALGPIRSISAARIDDVDVLLVGARDGVHVVGIDDGVRVRQSFRHDTGSEFGFNSACFLDAGRRIVATHSQAGIVSWLLDDASALPMVEKDVARARSAVAVDADRIVLLVEGRMAAYSPGGSIEPFAGNSRLMSVGIEGREGVRRRKLIREDPVGSNEARYSPSVAVEDEIDVAGVPRAIRALAAGGLEMVDVAESSRLPIGSQSLVARSVVARPGFVAAVSVDRTRVSLIDLARPDATHAVLNVSIALGSRIADMCFA